MAIRLLLITLFLLKASSQIKTSFITFDFKERRVGRMLGTFHGCYLETLFNFEKVAPKNNVQGSKNQASYQTYLRKLGALITW